MANSHRLVSCQEHCHFPDNFGDSKSGIFLWFQTFPLEIKIETIYFSQFFFSILPDSLVVDCHFDFKFFVRFLQIAIIQFEKIIFWRSIFLDWFDWSDESIDREKKKLFWEFRRIRNCCSPPTPFNTPIAIISWTVRCLSMLGISINSLQLCITNFPRMHLVYYRGFEINKLLVFDTTSTTIPPPASSKVSLESFAIRCSILEKFLFAGSQVFWINSEQFDIDDLLNILNIFLMVYFLKLV